MEELEEIDLVRGAIISVAVQIGGVRLIDKFFFNCKGVGVWLICKDIWRVLVD